MLCDFYEVDNWPDLVRELVNHVEQLQDSARRNVKPWEDTFPETLLPAYIDRVKQADDICRAATFHSANSGIPVIPDGWKMVPAELTPEMQAAWDKADCNNEDDTENMMNAYRAMIAAAPTQEGK